VKIFLKILFCYIHGGLVAWTNVGELTDHSLEKYFEKNGLKQLFSSGI
jgi:hypothetical protein